jgi:very-short-patch-repair endonuclease/predicted transcriptional regulator of viral defense system
MLADQRLHALAARQHGCVTVDQARAAGLSVSQIHRRLRDERFERLGHHVLRVAGSPHSWEQQLMAALLDHGDGAVVSHHAAAALHAFDGFPRQPVEVTMTRAARGRRAHWRLHTTRRLELIDRTEIDGFRSTTASRTIIDLAATASVSQLERAIDSAVRDGWSSPAFLRRRLGALRGRGRRGVRLLDELLEDSGGHSDLERRFLALVRRAGLPKPTCQRILGRGETVSRVDFSFEPRPVLVEVSGRRGHASDAERAKDARRRNELQELGFVVLEFTNRQVREQPGYVIATLRRHLA